MTSIADSGTKDTSDKIEVRLFEHLAQFSRMLRPFASLSINTRSIWLYVNFTILIFPFRRILGVSCDRRRTPSSQLRIFDVSSLLQYYHDYQRRDFARELSYGN